MLQTCPNHLSKSPCELRFSRLLLPESHAQCVLIHTGTPDSQVRFGQKGCISKTVVDKGAFIRGPIRGLDEVNTRSAYMVCPRARHELLKRDCSTWAGKSSGGGSSSRRKQQQEQEEAATAGGSSSSSRKQQQQHQKAAAGGGSSSSRKQQQQQAASSKQQQAAASSRKQQQQQAASSSKQQPAAATSSNQHVPPWKNDQI